jgi:hypothetical protein
MKTSLQGLLKSAQQQLKRLEADAETIQHQIGVVKAVVSSLSANGASQSAAPSVKRTHHIADRVKARFQNRVGHVNPATKPAPAVPWFSRARTPSAIALALYKHLQSPTPLATVAAAIGEPLSKVRKVVENANTRAKGVKPFQRTEHGWVLHPRYRVPSETPAEKN